MTPNKKQLLIFDFDGTLIDSVPDLAAAINTMLSQLNKPTFKEADIRNWVGNGAAPLVHRALTGGDETYVDEQTLTQAMSLFFNAYAQQSGKQTCAYDGVDTGLKKLNAAGFRLALVTNKPMRFVPKILQGFGWQNLFSEVLGGDSLPQKKPDPAPLQHVCKSLKITAENAVMIGDSKNDILAGQNAGMDTLALSYGYNYGQAVTEFNPTAAFDHFNDLVAFIITHYGS